jgi:hypothetical protein
VGEESKSSLSNVLALLGWIVAALSLAMNYLDYQAKEADRQAILAAAPTYSLNFSSINPNSFPLEIRDVQKPVRQPFSIKHETGDQVINLRLDFEAKGGNILGLEVDQGAAGTKQDLQKDGRELVFQKDVLLPGETVSGNIITNGLVAASVTSGAEKGKPYTGFTRTVEEGPWYTSENAIGFGIFLAVVIVILGSLYWFAPTIIQTAESPQTLSQRWKITWVIAIGLLTVFGSVLRLPGPTQIFYAILLYLLITNLGKVRALFDR